MHVNLRWNAKQRTVEQILRALAETSELKPGIITRGVRAAIAKIPVLTPEMVAQTRIATLLKRIGLSPEMLAREHRAARDAASSHDDQSEAFDAVFTGNPRDANTPEMDALERLRAALADHIELTPELVVRTLLARPEKEEARKAKLLYASQLGKKGAAARHAPDKEKREELLRIWATGKYANKTLCAEEEHAYLRMAYDTAINALKGAPAPNPWPGKDAVKAK